MKISDQTVGLVSVSLILLAMVLGCGAVKSGPQWVKSKKIAGNEQGLSHISGMVVDDKFAYVTIGGTVADQNEGNSGVRKVAIDTGAVTVIDDGVKNVPQSDYGGMAVDDKYLYWNASGSIFRAAIDGGKPEAIVSENVGIGIDVTVDNEKVYWINHGYYVAGQPSAPKPVYSAPKSGGKSEIVADEQKIPHSIVVDEKNIYWLTSTAIISLPKTGGVAKEVFAIGDKEGLDQLSQDADSLYFGYRGAGESRWALRKVAKSGGEPVTLVKRYSNKPTVVDGANVYFFDEESTYLDALCRVPKNGGEVTRLDTGYASGVIAQSKTLVFFAAMDDILSFPK